MVRNPPAMQKIGDLGSIPGLRRSLGGGHSNPLQHSCLENPHGQRRWAGYSSWGRKELDTTEQLCTASVRSAAQSRSSVCDPTDCSTPGFPVHSQSLLKLMSIELVMQSSHLILCRPILLLPSIFPSIRVFSNESVPCIR